MRDEQMSEATLPAWAEWSPSRPYSIGIEEEVMLLDPRNWSLAHRMESILPRLSPMLTAAAVPALSAAARIWFRNVYLTGTGPLDSRRVPTA